MVFEKDGADWRYSQKGWTAVFQSVTSCTHKNAVPVTFFIIFHFFRMTEKFNHGRVSTKKRELSGYP